TLERGPITLTRMGTRPGGMTTGAGSSGRSSRTRRTRGPSGGSAAKEGAAGGDRAGLEFTQAGKAKGRTDNRAANGGKLTCENCGRSDLVDPKRAEGGQPRPTNEGQVDHIIPKAKGGDGAPPNGKS